MEFHFRGRLRGNCSYSHDQRPQRKLSQRFAACTGVWDKGLRRRQSSYFRHTAGIGAEAKRMADAGSSAKEIKDYLEATALQSSIYLTVASLKYLRAGGRLGPSAAMLGTLLNIKPVLSIQGGQIEGLCQGARHEAVRNKMIKAVQNDITTRFAGIPAESSGWPLPEHCKEKRRSITGLRRFKTRFPICRSIMLPSLAA